MGGTGGNGGAGIAGKTVYLTIEYSNIGGSVICKAGAGGQGGQGGRGGDGMQGSVTNNNGGPGGRGGYSAKGGDVMLSIQQSIIMGSVDCKNGVGGNGGYGGAGGRGGTIYGGTHGGNGGNGGAGMGGSNSGSLVFSITNSSVNTQSITVTRYSGGSGGVGGSGGAGGYGSITPGSAGANGSNGGSGGYGSHSAQIYNNILYGTNQLLNVNYYTNPILGKNIMGGNYIAGNYWTSIDENGFSDQIINQSGTLNLVKYKQYVDLNSISTPIQNAMSKQYSITTVYNGDKYPLVIPEKVQVVSYILHSPKECEKSIKR